jgi:hypothetical protein
MPSPQLGTPEAIPTAAAAAAGVARSAKPPVVAAAAKQPVITPARHPQEKNKRPGKSKAENPCAEEEGSEEGDHPDDNTKWDLMTASPQAGAPASIPAEAVAGVAPPAKPSVVAATAKQPVTTPEKNPQEKLIAQKKRLIRNIKSQGKPKAKNTNTERDGLGTIKIPDENTGSPSRSACAFSRGIPRGIVSHSISLPPGPLGAVIDNQSGLCKVSHLIEPTSLLQASDILESLNGEPLPKNGTIDQCVALLAATRDKPRRLLRIRRRDTHQTSSSTKNLPAKASTYPVVTTDVGDGNETINSSREEKAKRAPGVIVDIHGPLETSDSLTKHLLRKPEDDKSHRGDGPTKSSERVVQPATPPVVTVAKLVPAITPENFQDKKCAGNSKTENTHAEVNGLGTVKHPDGNAGSPSRGACARGMVSHSISLPPGPIGASIENRNGFCGVNHLTEPTSLLQMGDILESLDGEPFPKYCTLYQWAMFIHGTRNKPRRHLKIRRRETQPIPSTNSDPTRASISPAKAANMGDGDGEFNSCLAEEKTKRSARKGEATTKLPRISLGKPEAEKKHVEAQLRQTKHLDFQGRVSSERVREVASRRAPEREEKERAIKKSNNVVFYGTKQKRSEHDGLSWAPCLRTTRTGRSPSKSTGRRSSTPSWSTTDLAEWMKPVDKSLEGLGWKIIRQCKKKYYFAPGEDWGSQCGRLCTIRKLMDFLKNDSKWKNLSEIKTAIERFETARKQGKEQSDNRNRDSDEEEEPSQNAKKNRATLVMDLEEPSAVTTFMQGEESAQRKMSDTPLAATPDAYLADDYAGTSTDHLATLRTYRSKQSAAMVAVAAPPRKRRKSKAISPSEERAENKQGKTEELDVKPGLVASSNQIEATNPSQRSRKVKRALSVGDDASSEDHGDNLGPLETVAGRENEKIHRDAQECTAETETELPSIRTTLRSLKTVRTFCQKEGVYEELCEELDRKIRYYWLDKAMSTDSPTMFV